MDYYNIEDPSCEGYRVEYKGTWRDDAVEASHSGGWVKVEEETHAGWGYKTTTKKTLYGRVFIVKYVPHEEEPVEEISAEPTYD